MPTEFEDHHKARMERRAAEETAAEMRRSEILQGATKIAARRAALCCAAPAPQRDATERQEHSGRAKSGLDRAAGWPRRGGVLAEQQEGFLEVFRSRLHRQGQWVFRLLQQSFAGLGCVPLGP